MSRAENRAEEQRVWKNRLNKLFDRTIYKKVYDDVKTPEDLKKYSVGIDMKNSGCLSSKPDKWKKANEKSEIKKDRQNAKSEISRELIDLSAIPTEEFYENPWERLKEIEYLQDHYNKALIDLEEEKYRLEKYIDMNDL